MPPEIDARELAKCYEKDLSHQHGESLTSSHSIPGWNLTDGGPHKKPTEQKIEDVNI